MTLSEPPGSKARSRRALATWPVARTLYIACSIRPSSSTTKIERITPVTVLPYDSFSPYAPQATSTVRDGSDSSVIVSFSARNSASVGGPPPQPSSRVASTPRPPVGLDYAL